jgi:hypothetical protein
MVRIADATGIPLDTPLAVLAGGLPRDLGLQRYGSAANTQRLGLAGKALGALLRPLASVGLRLMGRLGRAFGR